MKKEDKALSIVRVDHVWSVLCGNSSVDQMSQNISLFNVFEQLNLNRKEVETQKKPGAKLLVPMSAQLVTLLKRTGVGDFLGDIKIEIISPDGEVLGTGENEIRFETGKDRLRVITGLSGFPVTVDGYYDVKVLLRPKQGQYERIGNIPLQVVFN